MNQIAMRNTDQNIMLVDSSKFSVSAHVAYAPLEMLHTIVTDTGIRPEMLAQLKSSHVRVIWRRRIQAVCGRNINVYLPPKGTEEKKGISL